MNIVLIVMYRRKRHMATALHYLSRCPISFHSYESTHAYLFDYVDALRDVLESHVLFSLANKAELTSAVYQVSKNLGSCLVSLLAPTSYEHAEEELERIYAILKNVQLLVEVGKVSYFVSFASVFSSPILSNS